jgi:hypothetical protein
MSRDAQSHWQHERVALAGTFSHTSQSEIAEYLRRKGKVVLKTLSHANVIVIPDTITVKTIIREHAAVRNAVQAQKKDASGAHDIEIMHLSDYCQRHNLMRTPGMVPLANMSHAERIDIMDEKRVEKRIKEDEEDEESQSETDEEETEEDEDQSDEEEEHKHDDIKFHRDYCYSEATVADRLKQLQQRGRKTLCCIIGGNAQLRENIEDILMNQHVPVVRQRTDATVVLLANSKDTLGQEHIGQGLLICPAILFLKVKFGHVDFPGVPRWICSPKGECTYIEENFLKAQAQWKPPQQQFQSQQQQPQKQPILQASSADSRRKHAQRSPFVAPQLLAPTASLPNTSTSTTMNNELKLTVQVSQCEFPDESLKHLWTNITKVFKAELTDPTNGKRYTMIFVTQDIADASAQSYVSDALRDELLTYLQLPLASAPGSTETDLKTRLYNGLQYCKVLFTTQRVYPKGSVTLPYLPCDFTILLIAADPQEKSMWCRCGEDLIPRAANHLSFPAVSGKEVPMADRVKDSRGVFLSKVETGEFSMQEARTVGIANQSFRDLKMTISGPDWPNQAKQEAQLYYKNNRLKNKISAIPFCIMIDQQMQ